MLTFHPSPSAEEHLFDLRCDCVFSSPHLQLPLDRALPAHLPLLWTLADQLLKVGKTFSQLVPLCFAYSMLFLTFFHGAEAFFLSDSTESGDDGPNVDSPCPSLLLTPVKKGLCGGGEGAWV